MLKTIAIALTLVLANAAPVMAETPATQQRPESLPIRRQKQRLAFFWRMQQPKPFWTSIFQGLTENPSISMAAGMTLKALQGMTGGKITDEMLAAVDADFKAMKAAK